MTVPAEGATPDCSRHLYVVGVAPIITEVQPRGATWDKIPFPEGSLYEVAAVAGMFDVSRKRIYNLISQERNCLDRPMYRVGRGKFRRVLTEKDVQHLRQFFTLRVKR